MFHKFSATFLGILLLCIPQLMQAHSFDFIPATDCKHCLNSGKCTPAHGETGLSARPYCHGSGRCGFCQGNGYYTVNGTYTSCTNCNGTGKCNRCKGTGVCPYCHGDNIRTSGVSGASYSGTETDGESYSEGEGYDSMDYWSKLSDLNAVVIPFVVVGAAALSYGLFTYSALHNREVSSDLWPYVDVSAGYSFLYGFDVTARALLGGRGGAILQAGMGIASYDSGGFYHLGAGFYLAPGNANSISWIWEIGQPVSYLNSFMGGTRADYSHFFGQSKRHGITAGLGLYLMDDEFFPDVHLSYTYRLYDMHDDMYRANDSGAFFSVGAGSFFGMADFTLGYHPDEHLFLGLNVGIQPSQWTIPNYSNHQEIFHSFMPGIMAAYRLTDKKWAPLASVHANIGKAKEYSTYTSGTIFSITPEVGVSHQAGPNSYFNYSAGVSINSLSGFDEHQPQGKKILPAIHFRYIRTLNFAGR